MQSVETAPIMGRFSPHARDNLTDWGELFHVTPNTPGQRLFQIRLACGDGHRKPESLREFAERVEAVTGVSYDHKTISLLERDGQGWRLKDVHAFSAIDPLKRGEHWLAFGNQPSIEGPDLPPPGEPRAPRPDPRPRKTNGATSEGAARKRRKR